MNDMSSAIAPKSDQMNADDLISGPRTIRISDVQIRATPEQPVSIFFDGDDGKPFKPCKSMSRVLVAAWGPDAKKYVGRSATLYRDPKVKWGGLEVGGIRISHLTDIDRDMVMALTETRGKRSPYIVKQLQGAPSTAKPDTAEKWVADHLGFVSGAADMDRLERVIASGVKGMAKLETEQPALHKQVADAYATRRAELAGEGPSDDQHGDQHDGTEATADELIERIGAADRATVDSIESAYLAGDRDRFEIADQDRIEDAISARKGALK